MQRQCRQDLRSTTRCSNSWPGISLVEQRNGMAFSIFEPNPLLQTAAEYARLSMALGVATATCLNSDPHASTATKHYHPSRLKRAFAPTNAHFARRVSTPFWEMSARTAVMVLFLSRSDRRQIGKATTSLANPPSTKVKHRPVDPEAHARFAAAIKNIPPEKR